MFDRNEIGKHGLWTLALCYYHRKDVESIIDAHGNTLITNFLGPLVHTLTRNEVLSHLNWIRYSENGFHLRCRFWAADERQSKRQIDLIQEAFSNFKAEHPSLFEGPPTLSRIAQNLNDKIEGGTLRTPGTLEIGPVTHTDEESVYDSWEAYDFCRQVQSRSSLLCLKAMEAGESYARKLALAQISGFDLLYALSTSWPEFYKYARFISRTWCDFFNLDPTGDYERTNHIWSRRSAFYKLFDSRSSFEQSLVLVPHQLQSDYLNLFDTIDDDTVCLVRNQMVERYAMQVLSLFHQQFNRLGLSINEETAYAQLLSEYAWHRTANDSSRDEDQTVDDWIKYWNQNHVRH